MEKTLDGESIRQTTRLLVPERTPDMTEVMLLMEYCEGGSLYSVSKRLRETKRHIGESVIAKLATGILAGLDYLHSRRIIHRGSFLRRVEHSAFLTFFEIDVKPANILLTREGEIRLCDFGVSGILTNSLAGTYTGTAYYMSVSIRV